MSKNISEKQILNKYTDIKDLYNYFDTNNDDEIIMYIFKLLRKEIDNYNRKKCAKDILIGFNLIAKIVDQNRYI